MSSWFVIFSPNCSALLLYGDDKDFGHEDEEDADDDDENGDEKDIVI
jgi:hypothetical protein